MKSRLRAHGGVANPRDSYGYRCGLRLALSANPSISLRAAICGAAHRHARDPLDEVGLGVCEVGLGGHAQFDQIGFGGKEFAAGGSNPCSFEAQRLRTLQSQDWIAVPL